MATFSPTINGVNVTFKHNEKAAANDRTNASTGTRVFYWLDGYLNGQEGIFRISKLTKDFFEFGGKMAEGTSFAWVTAWTSLITKVAGFGVTGTTIPHFYTTLKPLKEDDRTNWVSTFKKVSDTVSAFMFSAMVVAGSSAAAVLGTPAGLVVLAGDLADLYMENNELTSLFKVRDAADVNATKTAFHSAITSANTDASSAVAVGNGSQAKITEDGNGLVNVANPTDITKQAATLQWLKVAKVVVGVFAGLLTVGALALPLISSHALAGLALGVCQSKMLCATLSLVSSVLAVYANYYKANMVWQVSKITAA